ncbi:MAG TPA: NAD-dependent epimerase/dehydratase family protein [Usitatibacter sp.]|nr:NAD-dependent epimerase/dehydratase family protein [Usitatibacter sp.]
MRLLILGGTVFLGRAITDAALARGHSVTHVHRGRSAGRDPRVETLTCDREATPFLPGIESKGTWDAVVDTSGYLPQVVSASCAALRERTGTYAFVSSISAYASFDAEAFNEDAATQPDPDPLPGERSPALYGALKAACERVVSRAFGERALVARPGLLVGPHDPTDRFTWWPSRAARRGRFLAPGDPGRKVQFIDVRDVAEWMIAMLERSNAGTFHVTGPKEPLTMGELIASCRARQDASAVPEWVPDEFLVRHEVKPWVEMPLWIPASLAGYRGFMAASIGRALDRGLAFRPLARTLSDTLDWARTRPPDYEWQAGLREDREAALLDAWDDRAGHRLRGAAKA